MMIYDTYFLVVIGRGVEQRYVEEPRDVPSLRVTVCGYNEETKTWNDGAVVVRPPGGWFLRSHEGDHAIWWRPHIPLRGEEDVARDAMMLVRDKVATTTIRELDVDGVTVVSRYRRARELRVLATAVADLREETRRQVDRVFYDSKSDTVTIDVCIGAPRERAEAVAVTFSGALAGANGGHGSITVVDGQGEEILIDATMD
jgi:hypothetical protein